MRPSLTLLAAGAISLASCGQSETAPLPVATAGDPNPALISAPAPMPAHNYAEEEDGVYFYVSAVSEEDRKKGKAVGDVYGYRYLGKNDEGQHVIASVTNNGQIIFKAYCSEPCKIIKYGDGDRSAFSPNSIIGSAFQDAINGALKVASEKNGSDQTSYPKTVSTIPKVFQGAWDELTQDGCMGREARFFFDGTKFYNFEVEWDVTKVDLITATEMDLHTTTTDENGGQVNEVWQFKLVDGGKSLTGRKQGGPFFRRCPRS